MKDQTIKIKLGEATYIVSVTKTRYGYFYDIYRRQKTKKFISTTSTPLSFKGDIKMHISEKIMQHAFYEVNHEIEKLEI